MFYSCEKSIWRENSVLSYEKFLCACTIQKGNVIQVSLIISQFVDYGRLKTKEGFKLLALKVIAVAYERWSFARKVPNIVISLGNQVFGLLENRSLRSAGRNKSVDCDFFTSFFVYIKL